jgi:hypothetical protein
MIDSDGAGMSEIVVRNFLLVEVVDSDVDVEIGLDVVTHLAGLLEILSSTAHAVGKGFVARGHPTALHSRLLLLVALLLLVLAEESGDGLHGLLGQDLPETASRLPSLHKLGNCSCPQWVVLA